MPLMRITHQRHAFTAEQKVQLAEKLTHAMLIGEIGEDTPAGRRVANIIFTEVDERSDWYVGGVIEPQPPKGGRYMIDVTFPLGAADQAAKTELHRAVEAVLAEVLGVDPTFPNRAGDWVMINEIASGNWGFSGRTMASPEIAGVVKTPAARVRFNEAVMAAQKRVREAHGFPPGAGKD